METVLAGADLVLPDRVLTAGTLIVDAGRIVEVRSGASPAAPSQGAGLHGHLIVPGFVDAHVHGVDGVDTLDQGQPIAAMAARLPRYGVTAFSPTSLTCAPQDLRRVLQQVRAARERPEPGASRVLPAHVEGPFLHHEYRGAQPAQWLRAPLAALEDWTAGGAGTDQGGATLGVLDAFAPDVDVVTLAPEIEGGLRLVQWLMARGIRVSVGHSSATYEQAMAAIGAGVTRATHLFNCMPPLRHREPGLAGAVLQSPDVAVEVIADGVHVHPAIVRLALAVKGSSLVLAVTDGTALSGESGRMTAQLGEQSVANAGGAARLADGRLAGSVATMDRVFRTLVGMAGVSLVDAAAMCATAPSRALGISGGGALVRAAAADFVVLDRRLEVVQTYVGGQLAFARGADDES